MEFMRHSVSAEVNAKEFLRLITLSEMQGKDLVIDKKDLLVLSRTIEMLLTTFSGPPSHYPLS